jgi:hypothetical protein
VNKGLYQASDGVLELRLNIPEDAIFPFIDAVKDTGKYVKALLNVPAGETLVTASEEITWPDYVALWSKVAGKTIRYKQISFEEYAAILPPKLGEELAEMNAYMGEFGYNGNQPGVLQPKDVSIWSRRNDRTTMRTERRCLGGPRWERHNC